MNSGFALNNIAVWDSANIAALICVGFMLGMQTVLLLLTTKCFFQDLNIITDKNYKKISGQLLQFQIYSLRDEISTELKQKKSKKCYGCMNF